jgi:hypothetical protein
MAAAMAAMAVAEVADVEVAAAATWRSAGSERITADLAAVNLATLF